MEGAGRFYEAALRADPGHLGALEYQGELYLMQGDVAAAGENLRRLREICGGCEEAVALESAIDTGGHAGG